jgi:photosystem II stability/assembly factor-like uncharacterized protein
VVLACALVVAFAAALAASGFAATGSTVVGASVPSATTLDASTCPPLAAGITNFGNVTAGSVLKTSADCAVTFGSSNDSASLRVAQSDGVGTAMGAPASAWTRAIGVSSRWIDVDEAAGTTWAVRSNGLVYRSLDDGVSWPSTVGVDPLFDDVDAVSASVAWLSGGGSTSVRRSTNANGGSPTFPATAALPGIAVNAIAGTSTTSAWVVGDGGAIRSTTDSGATWQVVASPTTGDLAGIWALDADSIFAWGSNGLLVATNDGSTWRDISSPSGQTILDVSAVSDSTVVAVGRSGAVYRTTNATNVTPAWSNRVTNTPYDVYDIAFTTAVDGIGVGETGVLLTTADAGSTWTVGRIGRSISVQAATRTSAGTWVMVGAGSNALRATSLAGPWSQTAPAGSTSWNDVDLVTDGIGWRVGSAGAIERTADFGATWTAQTSGTSEELMGVYAFDTQRVVAVGWNGTVRVSSNGGSSWSAAAGVPTIELRSVAGTEDGGLWAVGSGGTIIASNDFGATWTVQQANASDHLFGIAAWDRSTAVVTGLGGVAYRTTDGRTWSSLALPSGTIPVLVIDADEDSGAGYYSAWGGTYRTLDNGATWSARAPAGTFSPSSFATVSGTDVIGVTNGGIRNSTDGGQTWSAMTGGQVTFHWLTAVDAVDENTAVAVGDGNVGGYITTAGDIPDYLQGTSDWDDGGGAFGICLRSTTATPTWTTNASCDQAADGAHWRALPHTTDIADEVARTLAGDGNRVANFRFGLRVPASTPPGQLAAGITFVVVAPG